MTILQRLELMLADIEVRLLAFNFKVLRFVCGGSLLKTEECIRPQSPYPFQNQFQFVSLPYRMVCYGDCLWKFQACPAHVTAHYWPRWLGSQDSEDSLIMSNSVLRFQENVG